MIKEDTKYAEIKSDTSLTDEQVKQGVELVAQKVLEEAITYMFMNNADQYKYGSLMARLNTSQSLAQTLGKSGEYPKTLVDAHSTLDAHKWDKEYLEKVKKNKVKEQPTPREEEQINLSFAQVKRGKCYCCGKTNYHAYQDCDKRNTLTKD